MFNGNDYRPASSSGRHVSGMMRAQRVKRSSSSSGASKQKKGPNCKTSSYKRYWLTNTKAYKQPGYEGKYQAIIKKAGTKV